MANHRGSRLRNIRQHNHNRRREWYVQGRARVRKQTNRPRSNTHLERSKRRTQTIRPLHTRIWIHHPRSHYLHLPHQKIRNERDHCMLRQQRVRNQITRTETRSRLINDQTSSKQRRSLQGLDSKLRQLVSGSVVN